MSILTRQIVEGEAADVVPGVPTRAEDYLCHVSPSFPRFADPNVAPTPAYGTGGMARDVGRIRPPRLSLGGVLRRASADVERAALEALVDAWRWAAGRAAGHRRPGSGSSSAWSPAAAG